MSFSRASSRVSYAPFEPPRPPPRFSHTSIARRLSPAESGLRKRPLRIPVGGDLRYGWLKALHSDTPPVMFTTLRALARRVHAAREGRPIETEDGDFEPEAGATPEPIVTVYALSDDGVRIQLLGHAWLNGGDAARLQAALDAELRSSDRVVPRWGRP